MISDPPYITPKVKRSPLPKREKEKVQPPRFTQKKKRTRQTPPRAPLARSEAEARETRGVITPKPLILMHSLGITITKDEKNQIRESEECEGATGERDIYREEQTEGESEGKGEGEGEGEGKAEAETRSEKVRRETKPDIAISHQSFVLCRPLRVIVLYVPPVAELHDAPLLPEAETVEAVG